MAKQDDKIAKMLDNLTHASDEKTIKLVHFLEKMDPLAESYEAWLEEHKSENDNDNDVDNMSSSMTSRSADDEDGERSASTPKTKWQREHKGEWWKKTTGYDWKARHPERKGEWWKKTTGYDWGASHPELKKEHNWWHAAKVWWKFNKIWQQDHQVEENPEVFEAMGALVGVEQADVDSYDSMDYLYEYDALFDEYGDDFSQLNSIFLDEALEISNVLDDDRDGFTKSGCSPCHRSYTPEAQDSEPDDQNNVGKEGNIWK